jgi:hypothetical protein
MKYHVAFCFLLFSGTTLFAQEIQETLDKKTLKKMQKIEMRQQKDEELLEQKEIIFSLISSKRFVLEADNLSGRNGVMRPVPSNLNFFAMDSAKAVIQIGSLNGIGYNGVGGITDEGTVTKYEIRENKNYYSINIYLSGSLTSYTIFVNASYGTRSSARVSGLSGGVINFHGRIVSVADSRVYKGNTTF